MGTSRKLSGVFNQIGPCKLLVLGDLMLDTYTFGKVSRISPEAPVPIMRAQRVENKPGGAGNVALNLAALGSSVHLVGRAGKDAAGKDLLTVLQSQKINVDGVFLSTDYSTPIKNRVIADNQQMIRIDYEEVVEIDDLLLEKIKEACLTLIPQMDYVAISDYGKGLLSKSLLREVIDGCRASNVPVIIDPKGTDFKKYSGANILKPNWGEAAAAVGMDPQASVEEVSKAIHAMMDIDTLIVTRSKEGISSIDKDGCRHDYSAKVREVKDVTGAGDTVLAVLACALGNKLPLNIAIPLANTAAGIAVERLGCARITLGEIAIRSLETDVENKVFDEEHFYAIQEAIKGQHSIILSVVEKGGLSEALFEAIDQLSQVENSLLIVYLGDADPSNSYIRMLASLAEVDYIILKKDSLKTLIDLLKPDQVYAFLECGELSLELDTSFS